MRRRRDNLAPRTARRPRRGFTLAEVLATIAVLAIVLPVAMAAISQAVRVASTTQQRAVALELAQAKLDELVVTGEWQTAGLDGDFGEAYPGYSWQATATAWDQTDILNEEQLQLQVHWTSRGGVQAVTLTTLVYTPAETSP